MRPPNLTLKALASELKHRVWEDGGEVCSTCSNRQRDPDFGAYCESNSCLDCPGCNCETYTSYIETFYSPDEQEFLGSKRRAPFDPEDIQAILDLNSDYTSSDASVAIQQFNLISILKEQSSCL
jgi:hypothetical protein